MQPPTTYILPLIAPTLEYERIRAGGAPFDGLYYCPHHPDDGCACRKPGTVMIERAVADLGLDLSRAYVVGDQRRDIDLARRIGAKGLLVTTGPTSAQALEELRQEGASPDCVATDLGQAVTWLFGDAAQSADRAPGQTSLQFDARGRL